MDMLRRLISRRIIIIIIYPLSVLNNIVNQSQWYSMMLNRILNVWYVFCRSWDCLTFLKIVVGNLGSSNVHQFQAYAIYHFTCKEISVGLAVENVFVIFTTRGPRTLPSR